MRNIVGNPPKIIISKMTDEPVSDLSKREVSAIE